jgi:L-threonylcarbamoyladenylate synthase
MKTQRFTYNDLNKAAAMLVSGGIVAFPTETVYGLGVIYDSKAAFDKLVAIKHRRPDKPFTLMCGSSEDIPSFAIISETVRKIINTFLPGPLTIVVPIAKGVPDWVDLGTGKIGIRVPKLQAIQQLIMKVGRPLLVPSANRADEAPALSGEATLEMFDGKIDGVLLGNVIGGEPSTVIEVTDHEIKLLRKGPLSIEDIERQIKEKL